MEGLDRQPHIHLGTADACAVAVVVGDPERTAIYAAFCEDAEEIGYNREYRTFRATFQGEKVLIVSHGCGSSGAAICFRELIQIGVRCIIRAGSCGSLQPQSIKASDVRVVYAAAKEEGYSPIMEKNGMPAVASPQVVSALLKAAEEHELKQDPVITVTSDSFYAPVHTNGTLKEWSKYGCGVVEMECSALFVTCRQMGIMCGAVLIVDGCPFKWVDADYHAGSNKMVENTKLMGVVALTAASNLSKTLQSDHATSQ